jgi:hypothetical protein
MEFLREICTYQNKQLKSNFALSMLNISLGHVVPEVIKIWLIIFN